MPKLIVILGQTAVGKSVLAVKLAKRINGEVISADSRQVYKGMDIGTGKITKKEMQGIKHHLLDIVSPKTKFNVAKFKILAEKKIEEILKKGKVPILCGGTGFYIKAIVDNIKLPDVKPNIKLRSYLEKKQACELFEILQKLDKERASNIDTKNKVRLIRAIEIVKSINSVPKLIKSEAKYDILQIGLKFPPSLSKRLLKRKIHNRLLKRLHSGMLNEVKNLHKNLSWPKIESFGLEHKYVALYLQEKISKEEMINQLNSAIWYYAKRQMTWFKRDNRIQWFAPKESKKIITIVKKFLKNPKLS